MIIQGFRKIIKAKEAYMMLFREKQIIDAASIIQGFKNNRF